MRTYDGHTATFTDFIQGAQYGTLSPDVVRATKRVILDTVACTVGGLSTDIGQILVKLKTQQGGTSESTLIGSGTRLPCASASYVHAQLANAMDADETLFYSAHFANCIVMPALAVAERTGASGRDVITATALGFDVAARTGLSMPVYLPVPSGEIQLARPCGVTWAVFGTAAAAGRLLGLTTEQMSHALGVAFVTTPLRAPWFFPAGVPRPMTKYTMYGAVAEAGVNAALLAAMGFTGNPRVFDESHEFWRGFGGLSCNWDFMIGDLGKRWFIIETSFKPYPVGIQASTIVDLFSNIVRKHNLAAEEISRVVIKIPPGSVIKHLSEPMGRIAQVDVPFTVRYVLAAVAAGIPPGPQWHRHENLNDRNIKAFAQKIEAVVVPEWFSVISRQIEEDGFYRRVPTEVVIHARGTRFAAYAEYGKGDPGSRETTISDEDLANKFREFARDVLSREKIEQAIERMLHLEDESDVHGVIASLH